MSIKYDPQLKHLTYDASAVFEALKAGVREEWSMLVSRVESARGRILTDFTRYDRPDQMLAEYRSQRRPSPLFNILGAARRIRNAVDRLVVIAPTEVCAAGRAIVGACCHPYHNELTRGERGGKPRIYFVEDRLDNDALQALLDLVGHGRATHDCFDRWAIVAVQKPTSEESETPVTDAEIVSRVLFGALRQSLTPNQEPSADDYLIVVEAETNLRGANVFQPGVLLPASIVGVDIVRLLEGGRAMNARFQSQPPGENPAMDLAATRHFTRQLGNNSHLRWWNAALDATRDWHRQYIVCATDQAGQGTAPRGIGSLNTHVIAHAVRRDRLAFVGNEPETLCDTGPQSTGGASGTRYGENITLPELLLQQFACAIDAQRQRGQPTATVHLPGLDEGSMGQLFQMLMLAEAFDRELVE